MKREQAAAIAQQLVQSMAPYCQRIEIAGSIRRRKSEVKDIEIVAIPGWEERADPSDLFGERRLQVNLLHEWATGPQCSVQLQWIKPGTPDIVPWKVEAEGRYWRGLLPEDIKLDLFLCEPENWGAIFLIRTGSAEFSYAVATHAKKIGRPFVNGSLTIAGRPVATYEEWQVFDLLDLEWREPEQRTGWQAVRARPGVLEDRETADQEALRRAAADRFVWHLGDIEIIKRGDIGSGPVSMESECDDFVDDAM
jgi:DNA polymerase/3'-5' exonuclease PolX